jgi:hypothetical protein
MKKFGAKKFIPREDGREMHETIPCPLVYSCLRACQLHHCPDSVFYNNTMNEKDE